MLSARFAFSGTITLLAHSPRALLTYPLLHLQGLLYLLNENGYPHIHSSETLASIRLCRDLLNVEKVSVRCVLMCCVVLLFNPQYEILISPYPNLTPLPLPQPDELDGEEGSSMHSNYARGHFYTNDVKVNCYTHCARCHVFILCTSDSWTRCVNVIV